MPGVIHIHPSFLNGYLVKRRNKLMKTIIEAAKELQVIREVDVLVCGGGPAGIAAGITAARNGAKTLVVERYGYLGGMVTGSYVTYYMGFGNGREQVIHGIAQETVDRLREVGGLTVEQDESGDCHGDAEIIKSISIIMLEEAGAEILLHSWTSSAIMEGNSCKGVIIENKAGRQAILAKVVIDATADADICVSAGAETTLDHHDITLCHNFEGIDREKVKAFRHDHAEKFDGLMEELKNSGSEVIWNIPNKSAIDPWALTYAENETRKQLLKKIIFMRNNVPGYENIKISMTAPQLGVRESRKIVGLYTMTEDDMLQERKFDDSIGHCGAFMTSYENYDTPGLRYDIPYRILVPEKMDGLLATGRCVSATHGAINSLRLVVPCMMLGEATGAAAALALEQEVSIREVDVSCLRQRLRNSKKISPAVK
jgi:ribulose 1,5-bisphosphate synthetase/thiazole synthase